MPFPPYAPGVQPREGLPEPPPAPLALDRFILGYAHSPGRGIVTVYEAGAIGLPTRTDLALLIEGPLSAVPAGAGIWTYGDGSPQWASAFLGWTHTEKGAVAGVYDHGAMVAEHVAEYARGAGADEDPQDIALEDISFNVEGAWFGPATPLVVHRLCRTCGTEGDHGNPCGLVELARR